MVTTETKQKGMVIGSGFAYGLIVGGVTRLSSLVSTIILYGGIVGGLLGSFAAKGSLARIGEGVATTASGIVGMGIAAKSTGGLKQLVKPSAGGGIGRRLIQTKPNGAPSQVAKDETGIVF